MHRYVLILALILAVIAGCGDNRAKAHVTPPDSSPACVATIGELSSYPGTVTGTILGGGADLSVTDGECANQTAGAFFPPIGEDVIVHLTGLTLGTMYGVGLVTNNDLGFYVTTACPPTTGAITSCLLYSDVSLSNESGVFTATSDEAWVIVDTSQVPSPDHGDFALTVTRAACRIDTECTTPALPLCDSNFECVAGSQVCTGDDAHDDGAGDDGPAGATALAMPTPGDPTIANAAVCDVPATEADWFRVDLTGDLGIDLRFAGANNDLDLKLLNATGQPVMTSEQDKGSFEGIAAIGLPHGTYYIVVTQYEQSPANVVAVPYTLTLSVPDCASSFDCTTAKPVCSAGKVCGPGPSLCSGDDAGDVSPGDDGPAGARDLSAGAIAAQVCSSSHFEADYYKLTVAAGQGAVVSLAWADPAADLDLYTYDATGALMGASLYETPETVTLTYLPAGSYYFRVVKYATGAGTTQITPYSITATATPVQACATSTDCAAEFQTQIYRGSCNAITHACERLPKNAQVAANGPCDADGDCAGGVCSYVEFESNAQRSTCSSHCTGDGDCAAITGTTCDPDFMLCVPACNLDTDCGAVTNSAAPDPGEPWNYETCTVATHRCDI